MCSNNAKFDISCVYPFKYRNGIHFNRKDVSFFKVNSSTVE